MTPGEVASSLGECIDALDRSYLDSGGCKARIAIKELARRVEAEGIDAPDERRGGGMDLGEIKGRLDKLVAKVGKWPIEVHHGGLLIDLLGAHRELREIRRLLDRPTEATLDPEEGVVCISLARFDELRQAEEDLQELRVATDEDAEELQPPPDAPSMHQFRDLRVQVEVQTGRIDGLYQRLKKRADANRDFAAGVGARLKDQGERITRHHERAEETDKRLKSFGARLAEVEARRDGVENVLGDHAGQIGRIGARLAAVENRIAATRPMGPSNARDEEAKEAIRRHLEELKGDLSSRGIVRDGPIPPMGGATVHPDGKIEVR